MKKLSILLLSLLALACSPQQQSSHPASQFDTEKYDDRLNFFVVADGGRVGHYEQKNVARVMGEVTEAIEPEFIVSAGDTFHYMGVGSANDPIWQTNYEEIYTHPELQVPWYPATGNHEYQGNVNALIEYTKVSRRWMMPSRYYSEVINEQGTSIRLVIIDTPPLIDKYRTEKKYSDAAEQDMDAQLAWIEKTLAENQEDWLIVVGHHPIYAHTSKNISERTDMQKRVEPLLLKYNVDMYICGHIHSYQHIRKEGTDMDYVVNGSAGQGRSVKPIEGTQFCSGNEGFMVMSASAKDLESMYVDKNGEVIHTIKRVKK